MGGEPAHPVSQVRCTEDLWIGEASSARVWKSNVSYGSGFSRQEHL